MSVSEKGFNSTNCNTDSLPRQFHCLLWCSSWASNGTEVKQIQSPHLGSPWDHWGRTQTYTIRVEVPPADSVLKIVKLIIKTKKDPRSDDENWEHDPSLYDKMANEWIAQGRVHDQWMFQAFSILQKPWKFFPKLLNQCGGCTFPGDSGPDLITLTWRDFASIQEGHFNWQSLPENAAQTVNMLLNHQYPITIWAVIDIYPHTDSYLEKWYKPLKNRLTALQETNRELPLVEYNIRVGQRFRSRNGLHSLDLTAKWLEHPYPVWNARGERYCC